MFAVENVPRKGRGIVATEPISRGTCIISEVPFARVTVEHASQELADRSYQRMSQQHQAFFDSLSNAFPELGRAGVFKTNCLPLPEMRGGGLFETACLLNHSCVANAIYFWDDGKQQEVVNAARDISAGEEITVWYAGAKALYSKRQAELKANFGFECTCQLCSLPEPERIISDQRRIEYNALVDEYPALMQVDPLLALRKLDKAIKLLSQENMWFDLGARYYDGFQACAAFSDTKNATVWAGLARDAYGILRGFDSEEAREYAKYQRKPRSHYAWGVLGSKQLKPPLNIKLEVLEQPEQLSSPASVETQLMKLDLKPVDKSPNEPQIKTHPKPTQVKPTLNTQVSLSNDRPSDIPEALQLSKGQKKNRAKARAKAEAKADGPLE